LHDFDDNFHHMVELEFIRKFLTILVENLKNQDIEVFKSSIKYLFIELNLTKSSE